jgi:phosphoglycolate phosphatase-like HAD superfamily hydrolase
MLAPTRRVVLGAAVALCLCVPVAARTADPLPSWNPGPAKQAILTYVAKVTRPGPDFVPVEERVAVFDNDGTLWSEQPLYNQIVFVLDRVKTMVAKDPSLRQKPAFAAVADGDMGSIGKLGEKDLLEMVAVTQAGLTPEQHQAFAAAWLKTARHPKFGKPYTALTYKPQLELLAYLRASGFKTWIVSGGEVQFMRAFTQTAYGVPPEQVIGTSLKTRFAAGDGKASLTFLPELNSLDDGPGKPANIALQIGRAPLVAVGNSDGDQQMLEYSAASPRPNLQLLVHHDDAEREFAYDRASKIGRLDKALDEAAARGWTVVSMKRDWRTIFAAAP